MPGGDRASPEGQLDTRQLAQAVMLAKGWDATDKVLAVSVSHRITNILGTAARTGKFRRAGKRGGANVWALAAARTLGSGTTAAA